VEACARDGPRHGERHLALADPRHVPRLRARQRAVRPESRVDGSVEP
jgi:hypothetical protein